MNPFDLNFLDHKLGHLRDGRLAIFAVSCATRLLPLYRAFHQRTGQGSVKLIEESLNTVWENCGHQDIDVEGHQQFLESLDKLLPTEIDRTPLLEFSVDAVGATKSAIKCLLFDDFQDATWAAQCAQESVARYVKNTHKFQHRYGPLLISELNEYELMRSECSRQERDMQELGEVSKDKILETVSVFRSRAQNEPAIPHFSSHFEPIYSDW